MKAFAAIVLSLAIQSLARGQTVIGFDDSNPPFASGTASTVSGIYPALIKEAFSRIKEPCTFMAYPWGRVIVKIDASELAAAGIYSNTERLKKYDFSKAVHTERLMLYTSKSKVFKYTAFPDLFGKTVGVRSGWSYGDEFDNAVKAGKIKTNPVGSDGQLLEMLKVNRLDVIIISFEAAEILVKKLGLSSALTRFPEPYSSVSGHIAFNKKANKTELLKRLDEAIESMRKDGTYDRLIAMELSK